MANEMDMDIDMDLDMELSVEDHSHASSGPQDTQSTAKDASEADVHKLCPEKVHLRGLDNLTTKDIKAFAAEYYGAHAPAHIQWIDDSSANIIYDTPEIAQEALLAFSAIDIADVTLIPALQTITAKPFPAHPETRLEVRLAVLGDRKQVGARDRSRFYLLNPEHDPGERRQRALRGGNRYRDRDDGGYRSQRYDDREHRKRQDGDEHAGFDVSLYDDDEAALAQRANRSHRRRDSASGSDYSRNGDRRSRLAGKELFPERGNGPSARLRNRSASPARDIEGDLEADRKYAKLEAERRRERDRRSTTAAGNRIKAQAIKAQLTETGAKELFPDKVGVNRQRSLAFDAADETADLFAKKISIPFMDGSADERPREGSSRSETGDLSIKGIAKAPKYDFAIKGVARTNPKELFPSRGNNIGKELFSERLEGRGGRRQKAEDLFH